MRGVRASIVAVVLPASLALPASAGAQQWSAFQIAASPDGATVYATGLRTLTFARDPASGTLTMISDREAGGDSIAVAPDGRSVYVGGGPFVSAFARDPATGLLTHVQTLRDGDGALRLGRTGAIAVSPDGGAVYVGAEELAGAPGGPPGIPGALLAFARDPATSELGDMTAITGLGSVSDVEVSRDGSRIYAFAAGRVATFRRDVSGALVESGPPDRHASFGSLVLTESHLVSAAPMSYATTFPVDRSTVRVRARDDRSGVARVQLAGRRSAPRRAVGFRGSVRVARPRSARWLRVHDRAGNTSKWRRVRQAR